jgi:hypothetical protein
MKRTNIHIPGSALPVHRVRRVALVPAIVLPMLAGACGGSSFSSQTANVAGDYTVELTTGDNGCMFTSWTAGSTATAVPVTLTQQGANTTATVGGAAAIVLDLLFGTALGTSQFHGSVTGGSFSLADYGTTHATDGDCSYTLKATLTGSISGNSISGQITYSETTNGSPACGYHATCTSVQAFDGVRAPSADGG